MPLASIVIGCCCAVLLAAARLTKVALVLKSVLGRLSQELYWRYLRSTRQGHAVVLRVGLVVVTAVAARLAVGVAGRLQADRRGRENLAAMPPANYQTRRGSGVVRLVALLLGAGTLLSISWVSHAVAMGAAAPLTADVFHLLATVAWAGLLFYLALFVATGALTTSELPHGEAAAVWRGATCCTCRMCYGLEQHAGTATLRVFNE